MTTINVPHSTLELPTIPLKRNEFIETLGKSVCGEWEDILQDIFLNTAEGNVQFLDAVWDYFVNEFDDWTALPEALGLLPFEWQWRMWKLMVYTDYHGVANYVTHFALLEKMALTKEYGVEFLETEKTQTTLLLRTTLNWDHDNGAEIQQQWRALRGFFLPIRFVNGMSLFNWSNPYVLDWLRDNLSEFEGCPFYFEDDPQSLQCRYLGD